LIIPQSGVNKPIGDELNAGFRLYLKLHDERLGGRSAQVTTVDEGDTADTGKAAVDRLIKGGAHVLSGVASSQVMSAIREQVEAAEVPLLGSCASPSTLGSVKYIWRTSYVNADPGVALGGYLAGRHGQSVYVTYDGSPSANEQVTGFVNAFTGVAGHPELVSTPVRIATGGNLAPAMDAIRTSGAKNVFAAFSGEGAVAFFGAYRSAGLTVPIYAPGFVTEGGDALQRVGEPAMGLYTAMNYGPDLDNTANRTFASEYQRSYGSAPSAYAMASYDAAAVLDKALGSVGAELTSQAINAALSNVGHMDSPRGGWQFNQSRTPLQRWYLRQVRHEGTLLANTLLGDLGMLG
jgi:branched-chain amino acid transport system substrate-binding protein